MSMDLTKDQKTRMSASVPKALKKRLDKITHRAQWVHHVKISRSELITYLCSNQLKMKDNDSIIEQLVEERKEEEKVTATT